MHVGIILIVIMLAIINTIIINIIISSISINHHKSFVCVLAALLLFRGKGVFRTKPYTGAAQDEALQRGRKAEPGIRNLHHAPPGTELIYLIAAWAVRRDPRIRVIL